MTGTANPLPALDPTPNTGAHGAGPGKADERRFWAAYAVSSVGSGVGAGSLPLVAILLLDVSGWQASAVLAGVAVAVPLGPLAEFHRALHPPCAAEVAGSLLAPAISTRIRLCRTLLYGGAARCLWMAPILLAEPTTGLVAIITADSISLLFVGIFNPRSPPTA